MFVSSKLCRMAAIGCGDKPTVHQCLFNKEILFTDFINVKDVWRGVQGATPEPVSTETLLNMRDIHNTLNVVNC
jgi:hypothetical protein